MNHPMTGAIERAARLHAKDVRARLLGAGRPEQKQVLRLSTVSTAPVSVQERAPNPPCFTVRTNRPHASVAKEIIAQEIALAGISSEEFFSRTRKIHVTRARQVSAYRIRQHTGLSMPMIARALGYADHTSVYHAIKKVALEVAPGAMK